MSNLNNVATVMIPVADQDRAVDFYVGKLGFEKRVDIPFGDGDQMGRWIEVGPPGAQTTVALTPQRDGDWNAGRMTGISFVTPDTAAEHARLRDAGVDVDEEILTMDGPPPDMFWFRDLDGNQLLIVQDERGR
jgi:catechol 2,3-dioxygenase-like lactoylglutathione lyase family enzyme